MPYSLVIESHKYLIYVRILAGAGDGPLIWIDANGHIHVGPGGPGPPPGLKEKLGAAVKEIESGVAAVQHAVTSAGPIK